MGATWKFLDVRRIAATRRAFGLAGMHKPLRTASFNFWCDDFFSKWLKCCIGPGECVCRLCSNVLGRCSRLRGWADAVRFSWNVSATVTTHSRRSHLRAWRIGLASWTHVQTFCGTKGSFWRLVIYRPFDENEEDRPCRQYWISLQCFSQLVELFWIATVLANRWCCEVLAFSV